MLLQEVKQPLLTSLQSLKIVIYSFVCSEQEMNILNKNHKVTNTPFVVCPQVRTENKHLENKTT